MGNVGVGIRPKTKWGTIGGWECLQGPDLVMVVVGGMELCVGAAASLQLVVGMAVTLGLSCKELLGVLL